MADDIITNVEANENDVLDLKKAHYQGGGGTRTPPPVRVQTRLNDELVQMLKMGKKYSQFQGIDRCIRVLDPGTPSQRHCMSMMVRDNTRNMTICSSCDRIKDVNASPKTINSAAIKLTQKELEEMKLKVDPTENMKAEPIVKAKRLKKTDQVSQRRPKVTTPNSIKIEVSMQELEGSDPITLLLKKALAAVYELPITKFSEAESIRGTSEQLKLLLKQQGEILDGMDE